MTTPSTQRKAGPLLGTGSQTSWPFTFKVFAEGDIKVTVADTNGLETELVLGTDYSVTLNPNQETSPGGTVTHPLSGDPLAVGEKLTIIGDIDYDQPLDLPSGGNFSPLALENQLDRTVMQIQQLREEVGRALLVPVTSNAAPSLPPPEANQLIGWDASGENLQNVAIEDLATAVTYGTFRYDTFTGNGVTAQFTPSANPATIANLDVSVDGLTLVPGTDYTLVSGVVVFAVAPTNGAEILVRYGEAMTSAPGDAADISYHPAGTGAVATNVQAKLRENDAYWNKGRAHRPFANNYTTGTVVVRDGSVDGFHRNFGQIAEGVNGRLHLVYGYNTQHAITSGAGSRYCYSDDGGATWSAEVDVIPGEAGFDQRSLSMCVTPSGRILLMYAKVKSDGTAPTVFRLKYSDDNGLSWLQGTDIITINYAFARVYGRIKVVPGTNRLVATPYYRVDNIINYKAAIWSSTDDGMTWDTSGEILNDTSGDNESELVAISSQVWLAVSRGATGLEIRKSTDGGVTWSSVGIVPNTVSDSFVAPTLDKFYRNGRWYVLLGYCNRANDTQVWRICDVESLLANTANFGGLLVTATDMVNASGYQCTVTNPDGCVYFDEGTAFVEFKEYVGFDYSQVRFVRADLIKLAANTRRVIVVASGAITLPDTEFDPVVGLDTEGAAALDDLDTINGGREGQTVVFRSNIGTSSRDVILKSGTGNLVLNGDYRMNTDPGSAITLIKMTDKWYEVARAADQAGVAYVIAAGAITVPTSQAVMYILVDTEGAAATDDLDNINGGVDGQTIMCFSASSSRDTTFKDGTGNLSLAGDFTLTRVDDCITLIKRGTIWYEVSRSDNLA